MKDLWVITGPRGEQHAGIGSLPVEVRLLRDDSHELSLILEQGWKEFYGSADLLSSLCLPNTEVRLQLSTQPLGPDTPPGDYWVAASEELGNWQGSPCTAWHIEAIALLSMLKVKTVVAGVPEDHHSDQETALQPISLSRISLEESTSLFSKVLGKPFSRPDFGLSLQLSLQISPQHRRLRKILIAGFACLLGLTVWQLPASLERQKQLVLEQVLQASSKRPADWVMDHSQIQGLLSKFGKNERANLTAAEWLWTPTGQTLLRAELAKSRKRLPKGCEPSGEFTALCEFGLAGDSGSAP